MNQQIIELGDFHEPINPDEVIVSIDNSKKNPLPEHVIEEVGSAWGEFTQKNSKAKDSQIAYLLNYDRAIGKVSVTVFTDGYRFNQYLNRDKRAEPLIQMVNEHNYNPFASWILPETDNGDYVLFGNKIDFGNKKVSGFGGFTAPSDITGDKIDVKRCIERKVQEEMAEVYQRLENTSVIGLNYLPQIGTKGFDNVCVIRLNGNQGQIAKLFTENSQFSKQLIPVKSDPKSLVSFLESPEWEPTTSCVGGVFNYIGSRFGKDELVRALGSYSRKDLVRL